ncbi:MULTISPECIES: nicotinate-nucleotide--dimethylbenzimidazole phosphoribosyltransferase [unclassified Thiocapsa]|uniref:nicotinate-nucleotide--dimethylbenzimidazole phosphoribosyltransferase n=1 Tax=unclassified Thiocapsa TaxID=2641286 RepID=UPI0035B0952D
MLIDTAPSCASGTRVLFVELDSDADAFSYSGEDQVRVAVCNRSTVGHHLRCPEDDTDLEIEILRLRAGSEMCSSGRATVHPWICGENPQCWVTCQLDKHRLDVALSAGRHAAERAKLAGVTRLIGVAPSVRPAIEWWLRTTDASAHCATHELTCRARCLPECPVCFDPYDALRCRGRPEIAALVGVAIAAAQMGIPFCLPDPAGGVAAEAAFGLNPGVRAWLDPLPADSPGSVHSPASARSLCAV